MKPRKIRYGVVGMGHIAQAAVLPAFKHASKNSELTTIFSQDPEKHRVLSKKYHVQTFTYDDYDSVLNSGGLDAVYIALPNNLHCDFAVRAANAGIHILCEKPMAVNEDECLQMIEAAKKNRVKLMIAYRLHFEEANRRAVKMAQSGRLGELRFFNSVLSMQVRRHNIRLEEELGGGTLYDIGIYCIHAARYLFETEPYEVFACQESGQDKRFREVDEMTTAVMRFPENRLATFTCSFGASDISSYQIVGTKGDLRVDPAYEYASKLAHHLTFNGKTKTKFFKKKDQFAPELLYFSDCIQRNKDPEPSGHEGWADIRIIEALRRSAAEGAPVTLAPASFKSKFKKNPLMIKPPIKKSEIVHAEAASGGP